MNFQVVVMILFAEYIANFRKPGLGTPVAQRQPQTDSHKVFAQHRAHLAGKLFQSKSCFGADCDRMRVSILHHLNAFGGAWNVDFVDHQYRLFFVDT